MIPNPLASQVLRTKVHHKQNYGNMFVEKHIYGLVSVIFIIKDIFAP
jgi:hypothetical protein